MLEQLKDYPYAQHLNGVVRVRLVGPEARKARPDDNQQGLVGHLDFINPDSMRRLDGHRLRGNMGVGYEESYDIGENAVAITLVMRSDIMAVHLRRQVFNKDKEGNYSVDEVRTDIPNSELEAMGWKRKRTD